MSQEHRKEELSWQCICGALNANSNIDCGKCGKEKTIKDFRYRILNLCLDISSKILNVTVRKRNWKLSQKIMLFRKEYIIKHLLT